VRVGQNDRTTNLSPIRADLRLDFLQGTGTRCSLSFHPYHAWCRYSFVSATSGSIREARRDGRYPAIKAINSKKNPLAQIMIASVGVKPYKKVSISRQAASVMAFR
jgi:hypothetical protein